MDGVRFDTLTCSLTQTGSRRRALLTTLGGVLSSGLGLASVDETVAKKKCPPCKKRKNGKCKKNKPNGTACDGGTCQSGRCVAAAPPLVFNAFGCLDVGAACRGGDANCCSGRCDGAAPGPGQPDTSRCVGHDESTCLPGQTNFGCGGEANIACTPTAGAETNGQCTTTTGNAAYCGADGDCFACTRDTDCEGVCGPQAACIPCAKRCADQGGTACVGIGDCVF